MQRWKAARTFRSAVARASFRSIGRGPSSADGVLVTSLDEEVLTLAQLYRDRADSENPFDELKNQWGWAGFTTRDLARCRTMARFIALVYNWWNLFVRLAKPDKHLEAITSRPLLLSAIAERCRHARQTTLRVASSHAKAGWAASVLSGIASSARVGPICGAVDDPSALAPDSRPRCAILARRASAATSAAPYGPRLTGKAYINRLNHRFEFARLSVQLPFLGS